MTSTNESVSAQQLAAPDDQATQAPIYLHHYDHQPNAQHQEQPILQVDQEPATSDNTANSKDGKRNGHGKTRGIHLQLHRGAIS